RPRLCSAELNPPPPRADPADAELSGQPASAGVALHRGVSLHRGRLASLAPATRERAEFCPMTHLTWAARDAWTAHPYLRVALASLAALLAANACANLAVVNPKALLVLAAAALGAALLWRMPLRYAALALATRPLIDCLWFLK